MNNPVLDNVDFHWSKKPRYSMSLCMQGLSLKNLYDYMYVFCYCLALKLHELSKCKTIFAYLFRYGVAKHQKSGPLLSETKIDGLIHGTNFQTHKKRHDRDNKKSLTHKLLRHFYHPASQYYRRWCLFEN